MTGLPQISFTLKDNKYYFSSPLPFTATEETKNIGDITIAVSEFSESSLIDVIKKFQQLEEIEVLEKFSSFTDWLFHELMNQEYGYSMSFFISNMFVYYFYVFKLKKDYFIEQIKNKAKDIDVFSDMEFNFGEAEENIKVLLNMLLVWVLSEIRSYKNFIPEILFNDISSPAFMMSMNFFINPHTALEINAGINYKIDVDGTDNKFIEVFSVANLSDFLKFEFCNIAKNKIPLTECANCGRLFVPQKRSDTMYCNNSAPQDNTMTCKEYGAKRLWYEKLKENKATKLYRNIYMAKQMLAKNNPSVKEYREDFEEYKVNSMKWKKDVKDGLKTDEEFLIWLNSVKGKRGSN